MRKERKKGLSQRTYFLCGWLAGMGVLLIQHYSRYSLCLLAAAAVFMGYTEILGTGKDGKQAKTLPIADSLVNIIGITSVTLLGYLIFQYWSEVLPESGAAFLDAVQVFFEKFQGMFQRYDKMILLCTVAVFALGTLKIQKEKSWVLEELYRFLRTGAVFFLLLYVQTQTLEVGRLYLAVSLVFFMGSVIQRSNHISEAVNTKWYTRFSLLLLIFAALEWDSAALDWTQEGYFEFYILAQALNWKNILLFCVILGVLLILDSTDWSDNSIVYLQVIAALLVIFFAVRFYVGYRWGILIVWYGVAVNQLSRSGGEEEEDVYRKQICLTAAAVFTLYEAHGGHMVSAVALLVSILLLVKLVKNYQDEEATGKAVARLSLEILCVIGANAAVYIWQARRIATNFIALAGLMIVLGVLIRMACSHPTGVHNVEGLEGVDLEWTYCTIIITFFAILCLCLCFKGGSKIKIAENDADTIQVTVEARGKQNNIQSVKEYWMADFCEASWQFGSGDLLTEMQIDGMSEVSSLSYQNGRIRIVATDQSGMATEKILWLHEYAYQGG